MKILVLPNKKLYKKANKVPLPLDGATERTIKAMIKHVDFSQQQDNEERAAVGIAAPQVGVDKAMFYVRIANAEGKVVFSEFLVNPQVVGESDVQTALSEGEGCLSVPSNHPHTKGYVIRNFKVVVKGWSYFQKKHVTVSKSGYPAVVLQHECDHLQGVLFPTHINKQEPWHKPTDLVLI